jgi:hypothetical protein
LIVLVVGFDYALRGYRQQSSTAIGVLALLATAAIYIPALLPGYWLLTSGALDVGTIAASASLETWSEHLYTPIIQALDGWLPGWALLLAGALALVAGLGLIDRALPDMPPPQQLSSRMQRVLSSPVALFALGIVVTSCTLSVSVSLSLLVPLAARGVIHPRHSVPYIMGANIATFLDTLMAALLIGGSASFTVVLVEMVSVSVLSCGVLLSGYCWFERLLLRAQAAVTRHSYALAVFIGTMVAIPLLLLLA